MSLTRCLKKMRLSAHEAAILKGAAADYREEGMQAHDAAVMAVSDHAEQLLSEREDVIAKVLKEAKARGVLADVQAALDAMPTFTREGLGIEEAANDEATAIDEAAHEAATSPKNDLPQPTDGQKEAGNYKLGHARLIGLDLSIENPAGSERSGTDASGTAWSVTMKSHYGYIKGSVSRDGDHVDVFVKPGTPEDWTGPVFVIDQTKGNGHFDEHKVMLGFENEAEARAAYLANYTTGWDRLRAITETTPAEFKAWLKDGDTTKAFAGRDTLADVNSTQVAARQIAEAIERAREDDEFADYALRVIPGDMDADVRVGSVLPASFRWVDGEVTDEELDGTSAIRVKEPFDEGAVLKALHNLGVLGRPPHETPNGIYRGQRVALLKGESKGAGDDVGEILLADAEVIATWNRDQLEWMPVRPNEASVPVKPGAPPPKVADETTSRTPADAGVSTSGSSPTERDVVPPEDADALPADIPETPVTEISARDKVRMEGQPAKIQDFGEKIGGARKDIAVPTGKKAASVKDDRPGWARKYVVMPAMARVAPGVNLPTERADGPWSIYIQTGGLKGNVKPASRMKYATKEKAEAMIPLTEVGRNHRVMGMKSGDAITYGIYRILGERRRALVKGGFESESAATAHMALNAVEIIEHKFQFPEKPWLDHIERTGPARRSGDVTTQMFQDTFGFRGGEFGNWNTGSDGQAALNHAYDGLLDLADVIGVPPRALSLNGELAIAFGARGHGGKDSARAHYEPGKLVINLTKIKGAGSLAHEWFHALDDYLGRLDGKGMDRSNIDRPDLHMVSHGFSRQSKARPELVAAFRAVIDTMTTKKEGVAVDAERARKRLADLRADIDYRAKELREYLTSGAYNKGKKVATADQLKQWDAMVEKLKSGDMGENVIVGRSDRPFRMGHTSSTLIQEMNALYKSVTGRSFDRADQSSRGKQLYWQGMGIRQWQESEKAGDAGATETRTLRTTFYAESAKIDGYRASAYWSTPHEMGARAFESFIFDKMASAEQRSDYLVYGVENRFYVMHDMKPYPEGDERAAINAAFEMLFQTIKTEETEKGVAMLSRAFHGSPARDIERFDTAFMGSGEGAQAYGWGLYFASRKEVAEHYRKGLSYRDIVREFREELPDDADLDEALEAADTMSPQRARVIRALAADDWLGFDYPAQAITAAFKELDNYDASQELRDAVDAAQGQLYEVEVPEDDTLLAWDLPVSEQPEKVRDALRGRELANMSGQNILDLDPTGEEVYGALRRQQGGDREASEWLSDFGIKGIKYLDGGSRASGDGTHNYVIFSGDDALIVRRLLSRDGQSSVATRYQRASAEDIDAAVADLKRRLPGAPPIFVVKSTNDPRIGRSLARRMTAANAEGAYEGGRVYVVAPEMRSMEHVEGLLAHEVFHAALDLMGEEKSALLRSMQDGNETLRKDAAALRARYPDMGELESVEEVLADYAREGREPTLLQRWANFIRAMLRKVGLARIAKGWTDGEVLGLVADAPRRAFAKRRDAGVRMYVDGRLMRAAPIFYSKMADEIARKGSTGTGAEWATRLNAWVKAGAVKADEVEWSGIREWLGTRQGKVTSEDVLGFLRENGVRVEEVTLSGDGQYRDASGNRVWDDETGDFIAARNPAKYANYQLPGGTNYREVLLTLPPAGEKTFQFVVREGGARAYRFNGVDYATEAEARSAESAARAAEFKSHHWDAPNVLAHIRLNDRADREGRRVLFVEEIQSDWGQAARKGGFANATVPVAPFIGKTEAWTALALKRVIRMAAEEGYDAVAFVTGEQAAKRFSLDQSIGSVEWQPYAVDGATRLVVINIPGQNPLRLGLDKGGAVASATGPGFHGLEGKRLDEVLGKELADKIMADERGLLQGEALKLEAKGMRAFYDRIVPNVAKDVLKKVGGGAMQSIPLKAPDPERVESLGVGRMQVTDQGGQWVIETFDEDADEWVEIPEGPFDTRAEAEATIAEIAGDDLEVPQPGFLLTPAMREKAMAGLPLFSRQGGGNEDLYRTVGGGRPRPGFPEATRIRGADGRPGTTYRGATRELSGADFALDALGRASGNPSSGLGVWFAADEGSAARHGDVSRFHLDIRNPLVVRPDTIPGFDSVEEAHRFRERARAKGHDGIIVDARHLGGPVYYVAFDPEQVVYPGDTGARLSRVNQNLAQPLSEARYTEEDQARAQEVLSRRRGAQALDALVRVPMQALRLDRVTATVIDGVLEKLGSLAATVAPQAWERAKAGLVDQYGLPQDVKDQRSAMQGRMRAGVRSSKHAIDALANLTRAESRVLYEYVNGDRSRADLLKAGLPEESVRIIDLYQRVADEMGQEAVRLGQLDADAFERHRWAYVHRSYQKHVLDMPEQAKVERSRALKIRGDQYKGRGMSQAVPMKAIQNVAPAWWGRKVQEGKGDAGLRGQEFIRFDRRAAVGEGTADLEGFGPLGRRGRILETHYWPAGEQVPAMYGAWERDAAPWTVRDTKGGNLIVARDFTQGERQAMGEVDEIRYGVAATLHRMIHDVEVGRMLEYLAVHHGKTDETLPRDAKIATDTGRMMSMTRAYTPDEWVLVPESKIPGTSTRAYGRLAGMYVPGPVWNDVRQIVNTNIYPLGETYADLLRAWKLSKTALSLPVHMNNVMSNVLMADFHDVGAKDVLAALDVIRHQDRPENAIVLERFEDAGGSEGLYNLTELQKQTIQPLIDQLRAEVDAIDPAQGIARVSSIVTLITQLRFREAFALAAQSKAGKSGAFVRDKLVKAYENEDLVFRLAAFIRAKGDGSSDVEAGRQARQSFLDYQINAPWINLMRSTAFPFISFTYRALPMMLDTAKTKPWKVVKWGGIMGLLNLIGYAVSGGDEDKERRLLPEEVAGRTILGSPKLLRAPWNDANGSPVFLDVRRWIPVGDIVDWGQTHSVVPFFPQLMPSGPAGLFAELALNKSAFTGKEITLETDTPTEMAGKVADYLYKAFAPNTPGIPFAYSTEKILQAGGGKTDAFGREQSTVQAAASSIGVKLASYPPDVLQRNAVIQFRARDAEIKAGMEKLQRELQRKGIDPEEFEARIQRQVQKRIELQQELAKKMGQQ